MVTAAKFRRVVALAACFLGGAGYLRAQSTTQPSVDTLAPVQVTATRVLATEVEGPQAIESYDRDQVASTGAFSIEEFLASLPPGEEGTEEVVLVNGRPTFLDPATLPMGMVDAIDISRDGSMPGTGVFSNGRIINIRLRENYVGSELGGKYAGSFDGGGHQVTTRLASSGSRGKLRGLASVESNRKAALSALDRPYSREQDHRARGGRDLRLGWGYPAVIQSVTGSNLPGFPGNVALVAPSGNGSQFIPPDPAAGAAAGGQRRFNTAPFRDLVAPSERTSLNLELTYIPSDRLQVALSGSHTHSEGDRPGPPPVSPASTDTLVPGELNPLGQDVQVGLVHVEFGGTRQMSRTTRTQAGLQFSGKVGNTWEWEGSAGHRRNDSWQRTTDLDPALFAASLRASDPARRFNPFIDATSRRVNADLYPALAGERRSDSTSRASELEFSTAGPIAQWPAGPVKVEFDAELQHRARSRQSNRVTGGPLLASKVSSTDHEGSGVLALPLFGKKNARVGLSRLEAQLAGEFGGASDGSGEIDREIGVVWSPAKPVLFRARYSRNTETPSREFVAGSERLLGESLADPRRGGEALGDTQAITREVAAGEPEESERASLGFTLEPPAIKGMRFTATYRTRQQNRLYQDEFAVQDVINNEAALPGRVVRAPATPSDAQLGRPGAIVAVDITPGNTGEAQRRDLAFSLEYRLPRNLRLTASAERNLGARYEILPGLPFVQENGGGFRRPGWSAEGLLAWSREAWSASTRLRYTGKIAATAGAANAINAYTLLDLNFGYRWAPRAAATDRKTELKLVVGIGNVLDEAPPWADTVNGYRAGSPLGRSYNFAVTLER